MIPLRHTLPPRHKPYVNRALVALNVALFLVQLFMGERAELLVRAFGYIPARLMNAAAFGYAPWEVGVTLVTSLFLHGGLVHLFGNMIYLWVFGGAVEDELGHLRYFVFYIACGAVGSLAHTMFYPLSPIPSIGASGSIAGVLGAFFVFRRAARIITLFPLVVYWAMAEIPAVLFLPIWFGMQFLNGFLALASARGTQEVAGIAWWAHVGGFVFGAALAWVMRVVERARRPARTMPGP